jgi:hypothetical protein
MQLYELINRTSRCRLKDFDSCSIFMSISSDQAFAFFSALRRFQEEKILMKSIGQRARLVQHARAGSGPGYSLYHVTLSREKQCFGNPCDVKISS